MPLTLVLGPANSAKAGEVLGAYANAARREALLVVPTAADVAHYDRELAGRGAILGRTVTFRGLASEIARRGGYAEARLTTLQRHCIVRRLAGGRPGLTAAAGQLIADLQHGLITPERCAAQAGGEVARIYRGYRRELERLGRVDAELFAWRALDALRAAPGRWGTTPVFVYGFDDLTALERDAIETLARIVGVEVTVSLTYEPGRPALSARATVVEELRALAGTVRELPPLDTYYGPEAREALHHLERNLFEPGVPGIDPGPVVTLLEAGGELAEAELVADGVLELLGAGVPPEEIVIVCRAPGRSAALHERTLRRRGVPAAGPRRVPLGHTPLGRALLALARCGLPAGEEATAADLLRYLRAPGVVDPPDRVDRLAAEVARQGLRTAAEARAASGLRLGELDALREASDPLAELARHARRLLAGPHRGAAHVLEPGAELDARAVAAVLRALDELAELGGRIAPEELIELLGGLEVQAAGAATAGVVLIADPLAIRARRFRAVFVCGLCEGEFPAREAAGPFGELPLAPPPDPLARERYLLYASVSRATERVVLSYRSSDEDGNLVLPSPFVADVAELFVPEWRERRTRRLLGDIAIRPGRAPVAPPAEPAGPAAPTRRLGERALAHVRHREILSGGALESFASCPVKWLVEKQLDPAALDPQPEPLTRGSFMHDVLERLIRRLGAAVTSGSLPAAERILDELTDALPDDLAPDRPAAVRAAMLRGIVADLRRYLRAEAVDGGAWMPRELELRFGFGESEEERDSLPPVILGAGEDRVVLRGMIDRIDVDPAGERAIVRDYKSGHSRERSAARWLVDDQLQVGLYMIAVRRLLGLDPVAGFYQPLMGRELRPSGVFREGVDAGPRVYGTDARDEEALGELLAGVEQRAVELAGQLRRGELTPCPQTCSRDGCRYPGICWAP
jgi:RecB family exonuclease